jgi:hypothetical protein
MPNTYNWSRLEALQKDEGDLSNVVVDLVCGMTGTDGEYSAYIDTMHKLSPPDPDNFIPFEDLTEEWAVEIANTVAEERGFQESLDKQIEAAKVRPTSKPFAWQQKAAEPSE